MDKNFKALMEKRNDLVDQMGVLAAKATAEVRAFTEEEQKQHDTLRAEVDALDATINSLKAQQDRSLGDPEPVDGDSKETTEQKEERAFVEYLRSGKAMETRADSNFTNEANGAVIPSSIANKIIEKIKEVSPIYSLATHYNVGGTLSIPYYDESSGTVAMAFADEFAELESTSGKLLSISLTGFLAGALCKISRKLINNTHFDILSYVINKVAEAAVLWIDDVLINGTEDKIEGLSGVSQEVVAASSTVITADELIDLQDTIPDAYQAGAVWLMSRSTRSAIRKLKDGEGNYLLNKDGTTKWGYTLFGKPVFIADAMPDMAAGKPAIYYGDFSGLAVKTTESVNIEVLREKYATQHAIGVVAWLEMDAKVENAQKIAVLEMGDAENEG